MVVEVNIEVVLEFSDKSFTFSLVEVLVSVLVNVIEGFVDHTSLTFGEVSEATDVGVKIYTCLKDDLFRKHKSSRQRF